MQEWNNLPSTIVGEIFTESKIESVQNRCARTLANLALDQENMVQILQTDTVSTLGKLLKITDTKENIITYSRAARWVDILVKLLVFSV